MFCTALFVLYCTALGVKSQESKFLFSLDFFGGKEIECKSKLKHQEKLKKIWCSNFDFHYIMTLSTGRERVGEVKMGEGNRGADMGEETCFWESVTTTIYFLHILSIRRKSFIISLSLYLLFLWCKNTRAISVAQGTPYRSIVYGLRCWS